jgi:SAM-dependent methyltransferase
MRGSRTGLPARASTTERSMPNPEQPADPAGAQRYADGLRRNRKSYTKASEQEGKVWGRVFSDPARAERVTTDQQAAAKLKLNTQMLNLPVLLKRHGFTPRRVLSIACGQGRAERGLYAQGIRCEFHGVDVAADAVEEARRLAALEQLPFTYEVADLNVAKLERNAFDLVLAQNCLHHVLELEHLAAEIHASLRPGGLLWIHDYIGETQFQHGELRLRIVNELLQLLPEELRFHTVNQRLLTRVQRRPPGQLVSPFEAIRSAEIVPIFKRSFEVVEQHEFNSLLHLVCPPGTRGAYAADDKYQVVFRVLQYFDELLLREGWLEPTGGQYLLRKK